MTCYSIIYRGVQRRWAVEDGEPSCVSEADRLAIKSQLVQLMCIVPESAQKQISEALAVICNRDFPDLWPSLLPELVTKLTTTEDLKVINGVLETANSIFKRCGMRPACPLRPCQTVSCALRFRNAAETAENFRVLTAALTPFQAPLLSMFTKLTAAVQAHPTNKDLLLQLFQALRTMCRIFYSLNWITIPGARAHSWVCGFARLNVLLPNFAHRVLRGQPEGVDDNVQGFLEVRQSAS